MQKIFLEILVLTEGLTALTAGLIWTILELTPTYVRTAVLNYTLYVLNSQPYLLKYC
jgi:hypothetical protein